MAEKAKIKVLSTGQEIPVMFNPNEYSVSTTAALSGEGTGIQFQKVNAEDFTVTLFFDTYEKQTDVREKTEEIASLLLPTVEGRETKQPPTCLFIWGGFAYKGIIHNISQKFIMFLSTGIPVRAELTIIFKSVVTQEEDARFRGREACRKVLTIKSGDRLDLVAHRTLKDPGQWRRIAEANNISNPLTFPTEENIGNMLVIPA